MSAWIFKATSSRDRRFVGFSHNKENKMTTTISRLYNSHAEARAAVHDLEAAGVSHGDISIIASNADNWYDAKNNTYPDRDLDGRDDRALAH